MHIENIEPNSQRAAAGRFIVKLKGATQSGLADHEVADLVIEQPDEILEVYRIHRVLDDGRMELVGVPAELFLRRDCLLFSRLEINIARRDFDSVSKLGVRSSPPCKIEMQLAHVKPPMAPCIVALIFPAACSEAVGQWLAAAELELGDTVDGSPEVLDAYERAAPRIVKRQELLPQPLHYKAD